MPGPILKLLWGFCRSHDDFLPHNRSESAPSYSEIPRGVKRTEQYLKLRPRDKNKIHENY